MATDRQHPTTSTVNNSAVGNYTITYNVTDSSGNAAAPVTRNVKVIYGSAYSGILQPINLTGPGAPSSWAALFQ
jgi:hypothetical protein